MMNSNFNTTIDGKKGAGGTAYLSPLAVIALSFGYAVGWGSFVLPGTVFLPAAGPAGTIAGLLIGTAAIVVLAFNYHRMAVNVPTSGGTYGFVTKMFGPVMGGYEAVPLIRKLPDGDKLKSIAFSANAFEEDREKSLKAGMNGHIAKPLKIEELLRELKRFAV